MQEITLRLTVDEANLILEALGEMPYARIYQLVASIQSQASEQLTDREPDDVPGDEDGE